ncbi:type II toxin-antitoxin system Phd/YefM family antitoxin [Actinoplanes rectilineatus]|uniref:type II toxin-antitoxin system Phd/YefM family antitoxin n=1 Tax=Actinoplanes rectilineatus TaxID=113571 RepID=UPI0009FA0A2E|nr:type II toxin-antitoxin system Phd/YefM family antitoxin [Actinoplanes rectilineatus]
MAEPAVPLPSRRIELPLLEARTRLTQIVRLTPITGQVTVITDRGQPVAAIVPIEVACSEARTPSTARSETAAAGWMRRIEQVREAVRRQHAARITELEHALTNAWVLLDRLRPRGSDRAVDELRIAHRETLTKQPSDSD